jgi:CDP-diacylglycerol--serine O-phosphatidyltransferase
MKKQIPNLITLTNLLIGCIAITKAFEKEIEISAYLILLAALLDFLDGFAARMLNAFSEMGKILDSLSDLISFGLAPAVLLYQVMIMSLTLQDSSFNYETANFAEQVIMFSTFLITIFGAIRLARFSISEPSNDHFTGLPIPAAGILALSIGLIIVETSNEAIQTLLLSTPLLIITIVVTGLLMVSKIPMFSLKFKGMGWKSNQIKYIFILLSALLLILFRFYAVPMLIVLYILMSLIFRKQFISK